MGWGGVCRLGSVDHWSLWRGGIWDEEQFLEGVSALLVPLSRGGADRGLYLSPYQHRSHSPL